MVMTCKRDINGFKSYCSVLMGLANVLPVPVENH
jgi:hypothetical protein